MDVNFESVMESSEIYSPDVMLKPDKIEIEIDTSKVYEHLSDHNYVNSRPNAHNSRPIRGNVKPNISPKQLKKQVVITELRALYNCTTCGYRSMNRDALFKHTCTKKPKDILYWNTIKKPLKCYEKCSKCNFSTKNKTDLILHMKKHVEGIKKQCTDCKLVKTGVDTVFKCSKCNYTSKNRTSLKVHMHIHLRGTPYKCTECQFSGRDLKELIKHYDEVKDLRCNCGYATHMKRQMATHLRSHIGEKPFSCGICSFSTADRAGLQRHMKKKHIID